MSSELDAVCAVRVLRSQRRRFDYNCHNRIERGVGGLYAFWVANACLYIGKSANLSARLYQHRMREHNDKLAGYFRAFAQDVEISFVTPHECDGVDLQRLEAQMIHTFRPLTNILGRI